MYELSSPLLLVIEVTGKCNLQCTYCYNKLGNNTQLNISTDSLIKILDEAKNIGVFDINFCGGEPFVHKDFMRHIQAAVDMGFDITINTNGTLITQKIAKKLKDFDLIQHIQVSFDGHTPEINNRTRGKFDSAYRGFQLLCKEAGGKSTSPSIGIVVTNKNFIHLQDIIEHFSNFTDRIHLMNVMGHPELQLTNENKTLLNDTIIPKIKYFAETNAVQITRVNKNSKCEDFTYKESHVDCLAGHTFLAINPNLEILPCDICRTPIGKWENYGDMAKTHKKSIKIWRSLDQPWCFHENNKCPNVEPNN
jgi:MoaA/NifB/PqqE/SkfB family radical SAM enzyme